jgi:hypothetical protein
MDFAKGVLRSKALEGKRIEAALIQLKLLPYGLIKLLCKTCFLQKRSATDLFLSKLF